MYIMMIARLLLSAAVHMPLNDLNDWLAEDVKT